MVSDDEEVNEGEDNPEYDLMTDLLHANMFKTYSDMLRSESLRMQKVLSAKFGYLPMTTVATLGVYPVLERGVVL